MRLKQVDILLYYSCMFKCVCNPTLCLACHPLTYFYVSLGTFKQALLCAYIEKSGYLFIASKTHDSDLSVLKKTDIHTQ